MDERKAFTPEEFAALFGHEKTWAYRLVYAGKITPWPEGYGKMMIPASEVARLEAMGERYNGRREKRVAPKAKKTAKEKTVERPKIPGILPKVKSGNRRDNAAISPILKGIFKRQRPQ